MTGRGLTRLALPRSRDLVWGLLPGAADSGRDRPGGGRRDGCGPRWVAVVEQTDRVCVTDAGLASRCRCSMGGRATVGWAVVAGLRELYVQLDGALCELSDDLAAGAIARRRVGGLASVLAATVRTAARSTRFKGVSTPKSSKSQTSRRLPRKYSAVVAAASICPRATSSVSRKQVVAYEVAAEDVRFDVAASRRHPGMRLRRTSTSRAGHRDP